MKDNAIYNPKDCGCCHKPFKKGDKAILHDDSYGKWFFCSEECHAKWLRVFKVKVEIIVGEETPYVNTDEELEEFFQ